MAKRTILEQFLRDNRPPWQRWAMVIVGFLLLLLAPALAHAQADTVQIVWTAPGDDDAVGRAAGYEVRYSTAPISDVNWNAATVVGAPPNPLDAGRRQGVTVRGLSSGTTYYFAIKTVDDAGNWSAISNVLRWDWVGDAAPPAPPGGISAVRLAPDVRVTWPPVAESDVDGYAVYRATDAGGPFARVNATLITGTQYLDTALPANVNAVWYRVTVRDLSGNESAPSATAQVQLVAAPPQWTLSPVFPNPSRSTQQVCVPIAMPQSGVGDAAVDIVNAGGLRVRHIPIATAGTCAGGNGVIWDGLNEAGRTVAPGVYRAWLIAGDTRVSVKLVRVP